MLIMDINYYKKIEILIIYKIHLFRTYQKKYLQQGQFLKAFSKI